MATYNRNTILATFGNLPVKAAGEVVILPGDTSQVWNILTGELAVWDRKKNITLGVADIATAKSITISIGQGNPGELAKDLIHIGGDDFDLCKGNICTNVTKPSCGCPQVLDIFFDCTKCNETYTLPLHLDDSKVRSNYGFNEKAEYVYTITTECCSCDNCDPEHNCEELACSFVDAINGKVQKDPKKITYFVKSNLTDQYQPFRAARIFNKPNSRKIFCISPVDSACENCVNLPAILGINIDGVITNFTYTTKPGDPTITLKGQMQRVVEEINKVLEPIGGSAYRTPGTQSCCPYDITINTCAEKVSIVTTSLKVGSTAEIAPTLEFNPFTSQIKESHCKGCGASPEEVNLNCGFSIMVDPVEVPCDCQYPPNARVPNYYGRTIEPSFAGDGWVCNNHFWVESQKQSLPSGFGYFYQDKASFEQHNGGSGRNWRNSNREVGRLCLPDKFSRATNAHNLIKCKETYCVYNILSRDVDSSHFLQNAVHYYNTDMSQILIPEKDDLTKSTWEEILIALQSRNLCCAGDISCGVSNDEFDITLGKVSSVDVSTNDTSYCGGTITYQITQTNNVTVTGSGAVFDITGLSLGTYSFKYVILCDNVQIGSATVTGNVTN